MCVNGEQETLPKIVCANTIPATAPISLAECLDSKLTEHLGLSALPSVKAGQGSERASPLPTQACVKYESQTWPRILCLIMSLSSDQHQVLNVDYWLE